MTLHFVAPSYGYLNYDLNKYTKIFLAGSIDDGNSDNWQSSIVAELSKVIGRSKDFMVFNPRRSNWDPNQEKTIGNPVFFQQVTWELDLIKKSDCVYFHFLNGSISPVTMLELGLAAASGKKCIVYADTFWRKGNVEVICSRYNIPLFDNQISALESLKNAY